jgi:hypothetical protein
MVLGQSCLVQGWLVKKGVTAVHPKTEQCNCPCFGSFTDDSKKSLLKGFTFNDFDVGFGSSRSGNKNNMNSNRENRYG